MNDFIAKPVEPAVLYQRLLTWLPEQHIAYTIPTPSFLGLPAPTEPDAGDSKNQGILKELNKLPGLNTVQGLAAVRGNANKYLEVLTAFAHNYQKDVVNLAHSLESGQYAELLIVAHSLKGTAATLGAYRLADWVEQFERQLHVPLRDQANLLALVTMIAQEYNALSASTLTCMAHVPPEPIVPTALDADQRHALESTLDELDNLLGQGDTAAIALFECHTDAIRAVLGSECEALEQQIRRFGFIQAQNHLRSLRGLHD